MRFKALIAVGLASVLALSACGSNPAPSNTTEPTGGSTSAAGGTEGGAGGDVGVFTW